MREARDYALNLENVGEKIAEMLTELIKCVEEDVIPDLEVKDGDFPLWDSFIQYFKRKGMNLLSMPWLVAECLLVCMATRVVPVLHGSKALSKYRKVQDICSDASGDQKDIPDLFFESYKKDVHLGSKEYSELICLMASRAIETFTSDDDLNSKKEDATRLIEIFLQVLSSFS